jgi:hypothetical protein
MVAKLKLHVAVNPRLKLRVSMELTTIGSFVCDVVTCDRYDDVLSFAIQVGFTDNERRRRVLHKITSVRGA